MLEPIEREKAKIWNGRFEKKMKDMGLSQYQFIDRYRERFKKGRQPDVSKWMHVGEVDSKTRKERGFPAFETRRNIAEIHQLWCEVCHIRRFFKIYKQAIKGFYV